MFAVFDKIRNNAWKKTDMRLKIGISCWSCNTWCKVVLCHNVPIFVLWSNSIQSGAIDLELFDDLLSAVAFDHPVRESIRHLTRFPSRSHQDVSRIQQWIVQLICTCFLPTISSSLRSKPHTRREKFLAKTIISSLIFCSTASQVPRSVSVYSPSTHAAFNAWNGKSRKR